MFKEEHTQIRILKVRNQGESDDQPALFRRLAYLLNTVAIRPPGMPPSGILLVRHMDDPLPGQLVTQPHTVRANPQWEHAVQQVLAEKYRRAARPDRGVIPLNAEAVFFFDEAQVTATLALAMSRGQSPLPWWYTTLGNKYVPAEPADLLCREIAFLPAVLSYLAQWGVCDTILNTISTRRIMEILSALVREFRLDDIAAILFQKRKIRRLDPHDAEPVPAPASPSAPKEQRRFAPEPDKAGGKPPWNPLLPSQLRPPGHLTRQRAALLGIGLCLFHAPWYISTVIFQRGFNRWWEQTNLKKTVEPTCFRNSVTVTSSVKIRKTAASRTGFRDDEKKQRTGPLIRFNENRKRTLSALLLKEQSGAVRSATSKLELKDKTEPEHREPGKNKDRSSNIRFIESRISYSKKTPRWGTSAGVAGEQLQSNEQTRTQLHVPSHIQSGDFTRIEWNRAVKPPISSPSPVQTTEERVETRLGGVFYLINLMEQLDLLPGDLPGPWARLETLARALLGKPVPEIETDPLWRVLAVLDNRDQKIPLPMESRWLDIVLSQIRSYLQGVLESPVPELPEAVEIMLRIPAIIYVTATHVDIVIRLEYISIKLRRAGLDRNPGWMPRFSRVILFHFRDT